MPDSARPTLDQEGVVNIAERSREKAQSVLSLLREIRTLIVGELPAPTVAQGVSNTPSDLLGTVRDTDGILSSSLDVLAAIKNGL